MPGRDTLLDVRTKKLPPEVLEFLKAGKSLDYDVSKSTVGPIRFVDSSRVKVEEIEVTSDNSNVGEFDPYDFLGGSYHVDVINLVAESADYDPFGILGWVPVYRAFGSWDVEHRTLLLFETATWSDIVRDPRRYLDEQWVGDGVGRTPFLWLTLPFHLDEYEYIIKPYPERCRLHKTKLTTKPCQSASREELALREALKLKHIESYLEGLRTDFPHSGVASTETETYGCLACGKAEQQWLTSARNDAAVPVTASEDQFVRCPACRKVFGIENRQVFVDGYHLTCGTRLVVIPRGGE